MKKRNLPFIVIAWVIIIAILAGCGGGAATTTTAAAATTAAATTAATTAAATTAAAEPESSGDGAYKELWNKPAAGEYDELRIGPMSEKIKLKVVNKYDTLQLTEVNDGILPDNSMWIDIIRDQLNIEFDYLWVVPSDQWNQRLQLSISSGDIPDVLQIDEKMFRTFIETDSLKDLSAAYDKFAIPELKAMDASVDNAPIKQATVDGKMLAVPRYEDNHASVSCIWYRKDWADRLGLDEPKTIDELILMAHEFGNQSDHPDQTGIVVQNDVTGDTYALGSFMMCLDAYPTQWIEKNGEIVPGLIQDEMLPALVACRDLYKNNAIPKDFSALNWDTATEKLVNGTAGIAFGKWWAPDSPLRYSLQYDKNAEWKLIPLLSHEAGKPANSAISENMVHFYMALYNKAPANAEEALIKLLNFYYVTIFPANNSTWPQQPIPMTDEERAANKALSDARNAKGLIWNWSPALLWLATENSDRGRLVYEAIKTRDISHLRNSSDKSWYDDCIKWIENGVDDENYWGNWCTYASRGMDDNGVLLTVRMRNEGHIKYNVFYGGATETEQQVASTLTTMRQEYVTKFILGEVDESSWPDFVEEWLSLGGKDWWDEVKAGYAAMH